MYKNIIIYLFIAALRIIYILYKTMSDIYYVIWLYLAFHIYYVVLSSIFLKVYIKINIYREKSQLKNFLNLDLVMKNMAY